MTIMKKFWLITGLIIFLGGAAWGQTHTWTGLGGDNNWTTAANWTPASAPGHGLSDDVYIPGGFNVILDDTVSIVKLTIDSGSTLNKDVTPTFRELIISGSGSIISGTIGQTTPLSSITVTNPYTITISANITTIEDQNYGGAVTLGAAVNLTANSANWVQFYDTVNGGYDLTITNADVVFGGTVGGSAPLTSINVTGNGMSNINADINTNGTQTYSGVVTFGGTAGALRTLEGTTVSLGYTTGNSHPLTITGNGAFNGGSGITALTVSQDALFQTSILSVASVSVDGNSQINADITTSGTQTYTGDVTLGGGAAGTLRTLQCSGLDIGPVDGGSRSLTVTTSTAIDISNFYGAVTNMVNLYVSGSCRIYEDVTTSGTQNYPNVFTFRGHAAGWLHTLTGSTLTFGSIAGNFRSVDIIGNAVFNTQVNAVVNLYVDGTSRINCYIDTSSSAINNRQHYNGAVTLGNAAGTITLTGSGTGTPETTVEFGSTVTSGVAGVELEIVDANAIFNGTVGAIGTGVAPASVIVDGTSTIYANITTTGAQTYTGAVILGGNITLNAGTALVTLNGATETGGARTLTVSSPARINANITTTGAQTYSGAVTLGGNITLNAGTALVTLNGAVTETGGARTLTISSPARVNANITTTGNQTYTGQITLQNDSIILRGADVNINNGVAASSPRLDVRATGTVTLNGTIIVTEDGRGTGSDSPFHDGNNAAVYIEADILTGSASITPGSDGHVCAYLNTTTTYNTGSVDGGRIHYHSQGTKHLVYRFGADALSYAAINGGDAIAAGTYVYIQADNILGAVLNYSTTGNIYIIDVGNNTNANTRTVNFTAGGYIEIRGAYTSSGTLNLTPGSGVYLNNNQGNTTAASLVLPSLSLSAPLVLRGGIGAVSASITTTPGGITLGGTVNGSAANNNLSLNGGSSTITVSGAVGNSTRLGNIEVNSSNTTAGAVAFTSSVTANSYTQTGTGSTIFSSTQDYTGTFTFNGTALTVNNTMGAGGTIEINNRGTFTTAAAGDITTGNTFTQNDSIPGTSATSIAGDITANGLTASIQFNSPLTLAGNVVFSIPNSNGSIILNNGEYGGASGFVLTLNAGTNTVGFIQGGTGTTLDKITVLGIFVVPIGSTIVFADDGALDCTGGTWRMGSTGTSGFHAQYGNFIMGAGFQLTTTNFSIATGHNFTIKGNNINVTASGYAELNTEFHPDSGIYFLHDATLTMIGTGALSTGSSVNLCNLVVGDGTNTANVALQNSVTFKGYVYIRNNAVLRSNGNKITILPRDNPPTGEFDGGLVSVDNYWRQEGTGTFNYGTGSSVEFGAYNNSPAGTYAIVGNSTWYTLECHEPGANILFDNYPSRHTIINKIDIQPWLSLDGSSLADTSPAYLIHLSHLNHANYITTTTSPPDSINISPENGDFWYFFLEPGADMALDYVYITFCWSYYRIPVPQGENVLRIIPIPYVYISDSGVADNDTANPRSIPYDPNWDEFFVASSKKSYYNVNWFVANYFFYTFTEDSNGNGRIDRIRAQAGFALNGKFSGFTVEVEGYKLRNESGSPYALVSSRTGFPYDNDSIYIFLEEQPFSDGGDNLTWSIKNNNSLKDLATESVTMKDYSPDDKNFVPYVTIDTVPPRVNYAFALPTHDEIFFQMSEGVKKEIALDTTAGANMITSGRLVDVNSKKPGWEFIISGSNRLSAIDLAGGQWKFAINNVRDNAVFAEDMRSNPNIRYNYQYPSPKYPADWDYSEYLEIRGGRFGSTTITFEVYMRDGSSRSLPLIKDWNYNNNNTGSNKMDGSAYGYPSDYYGMGKHRVTDLLISIPPRTLREGENFFFVWPLWARYENSDRLPGDGLLGSLPPGYGYMGQGSDAFNDATTIWDFSGRRFLEVDKEDNLILQARLNSTLRGAYQPLLLPGFNIQNRYKADGELHGSPGLWHTGTTVKNNPAFINMVPVFFPSGGLLSRASTPQPSGGILFNYKLLGSELDKTGTVEFLYRINDGSDLLAARLDVPSGTNPSELKGTPWYRKVLPFSFGIHNIVRQRSGVTILNNVINSDRRERVFVDYKLTKSGRVTIQVFTLDGNLVKILKQENQSASENYYRVSWDGTNQGGRPVARGMYFIRVVAPNIDEIRKVMVVR